MACLLPSPCAGAGLGGAGSLVRGGVWAVAGCGGVRLVVGMEVGDMMAWAGTCWYWWRALNEEEVWRAVYEHWMGTLDFVQKWRAPMMVTSLLFGDDKKLGWKDKLRSQYYYNSNKFHHTMKQQMKLVSNTTSKLPGKQSNSSLPDLNPFKTTVHKLLFLGEGQIINAKRLVYEMMWNEPSPFLMTSLFPGNSGIGSGVGFEMNDRVLNVSTLKLSSNVIDNAQNNAPWRSILEKIEGVVLVLDGDDEVAAKNTFSSFSKLGLDPGLPLLVLVSSNQDHPELLSPMLMSQALTLEVLPCEWGVLRVTSNSILLQLFKGLHWLLNNI